MQVQTQITLDLKQPGSQTVPAMQYDAGTRSVSVTLLEDGQPWQPPQNASIAIGYEKPDRTRGLYDKLPDGSSAISRSGNTVTFLLARQMLSTPGTVRACVVFSDPNLNQLTTFPFLIAVQVNPAADAPQSEDYFRLQWLEDKLDEHLALAKQSGEFTGPAGPVPTLLRQEVTFQESPDCQQIPTGPWLSQLPAATPQHFIWSRTIAHYDSGDVTSYSVSRNGANGTGSVRSVCGLSPDDSGNVALTAGDVGALPCIGGSIQGDIHMNGKKLTDLADPTEESDGANRRFVLQQADAAVSAARQNAKTRVMSTVLCPFDWVGDTAPYTAFLPISNLDADHRMMAYPLIPDGDTDQLLAWKQACAAVSFAARSDSGITFTCLEEKPEANIPLSIELYV